MFTIGMACLFYYTWNYRNEVVYGGKRNLIGFVKMLSERIEEFTYAGTSEGSNTVLTGQEGGKKENWKPPPRNWFKANTDAAFKGGNAAFAFVLRDEQGRVLFLASKISRDSNAEEAELKALVWALQLAKEKGWGQVCWSSDAVNVVKEVASDSEPCCWETRYLLLRCKSLLKEMNWSLTWSARSTNTVADEVAKFSLSSSNCILFSFFDLLDPVLPNCIWEAIVHDQQNLNLSV